MRTLEIHRSNGVHNSLWYWNEVVFPLKVVFNYICMCTARVMPSLRIKNLLYSAMGIKIGSSVSVGLEATMDVFFPELIEIGENTVIGYNTTILCHEFLISEYRTGKVKIGKNVVIGANTTILPGVEISDGSVVSAHSLVNRNISGFAGGVPARPIRKTELKNDQNQ